MIDIKNLIGSQQKLKSLEDSINYIQNRLQTYYNTDQEKYDIERNIIHSELILSDNNILSILNSNTIDSYKNTIHAAKSRLGI